MAERIFSHLNKTVGDKSNSLRTVVPHTIVEKMKLTDSDMLEWIINKGDIIVRKL
jgi:bifunctional DNA-binding transcriptional regulator/antitoxin component of YhaV-PrlF toxin-antitoxin module